MHDGFHMTHRTPTAQVHAALRVQDALRTRRMVQLSAALLSLSLLALGLVQLAARV